MRLKVRHVYFSFLKVNASVRMFSDSGQVYGVLWFLSVEQEDACCIYIGKLFLFKHKKIKSEYSMTWQNMPMSCRMLSCRMLIYFLVYEGKELKGCEFLFSILVGY